MMRTTSQMGTQPTAPGPPRDGTTWTGFSTSQTTPAAPSTAMTSGCPAPGTGGTRQDLRGPRRRRRRSDQQLGMRAIHGAQFLGPPIAPRKVSGAHTLPDSIGTRPGRHPRRGRRCPPRRGETQCRQRPNASTRSSCSCVGACRAWPHARPSACPWTLVGARCRERPSTRASRRWPALAPGHLARHCLSGVPGAPRTTRTLRLARAALLGTWPPRAQSRQRVPSRPGTRGARVRAAPTRPGTCPRSCRGAAGTTSWAAARP